MWENTTTITKQDYLFLNKKTLKTVYLLLAIGFLGLICSIFITILKDSFWFLIVASVTLIFGGVVCLILLLNGQKQTVGQKINYTFKQNGFLVSTAMGSSDLSYSIIVNLKENDTTLLLYISKNQAYVVDKTTLDKDCVLFIKQTLDSLKLENLNQTENSND